MSVHIPSLPGRPSVARSSRAQTISSRRRFGLGLAAGVVLALPSFAQTAPKPAAPLPPPAPAIAQDEVLELSPFVVSTEKDVGYQAMNTLAGTRLNTDIKDIGAAVSVYTKEFLDDISVTKLEDILTYTASTEAGGKNGNYSGASLTGGENAAEVRDDPSSVNRVRALASATRTRDFFASDIPTDTYSYDNLTINRGPNAILAGVGNAGGIMDSGMRKATFKDSYRFVSRVGSYDSHREEAHLNKVLIPQRLAVSLSLLNDDQGFRQNPAYALDRRLYTALQARLIEPKRGSFLGRGTFRANYETGRIEGIPPDNITPTTYMDNWFMPSTRTTYDAGTGVTTPGQTFPANAKYFWDPTYVNNATSKGAYFPASGGNTPLSGTTGIAGGFPLFSGWSLIFANPTASTARVDPTGSVPALNNLQGFVGGVPLTITPLLPLGPGGALRGSGDPDRLRLGFFKDHLTDPRIFDFYNNLLTGALDFRTQRFNASDFRYEQLFMGGKAGMELAYNNQTFTRYRNFAVANGNDEGIYIDVNKYLTIRDTATGSGTGIVNPNFGRPFISTQDAFKDQRNKIDREAYQLTAFYKQDFTRSDSRAARFLGSHTLSTLFFKTNIDRSNRTYSSTWDPAGQLDPVSLGEPGSFNAQVNAWFYIGPSLVNTPTVSDVRLQPIAAARPQYGSAYTLRVWDPATQQFVTGSSTPLRVLSRVIEQHEELNSTAFALQSQWLKNHITTVFGWRDDRDQNFTSGAPPRLSTGGLDESKISLLPSASEGKRSVTKSVVGLLPVQLPGRTQIRAFWNEAGNFNPVGQRRNIWNEEVGSANADTREYGISISSFNEKFFLRVNRFRTRIRNDSISVSNPYGYISSMIQRMITAREQGLTPFDFGYKYSSTLPVSAITAANNEWQSFSDVARAFYESIPQRLRNNIGPKFNFDPHFTGSGDTLKWNPDNIVNLTSLNDTESTGTEYEAIVNPTRGWRVAMSVAKNEAVRSNVALEEVAFATEWLNAISVNPTTVPNSNTNGINPTTLDAATLQKYKIFRLGFGSRAPGSTPVPATGASGALSNGGIFTANSTADQYRGETLELIRAQAARSGTPSPEIRKWRFNFVTRYEFQSGFLRGFSLGGAVRWQDRVGIGYPLVSPRPTVVIDGVTYSYDASDRSRPFWGPSDIKFDVNFGYKRKFTVRGAPITWTVGVSIRNLNAKDELIPIGANADGTIGFFRVPPERTWGIGNSFAF